MGKSLKTNFVYTLANTIVGLLYPIVTFPYISRVLMPDGIGQVQFFQSIINYISLFAALGIPLYAVKEIARVKNDIEARNKTIVEILLLYVSLTIIGYLVVFILIVSIDKINADWPLLLLLSSHLILVAIGAEWFYQGIEEFKFISIRSLLIKFISLIALFIFIRDKNDLYIYALLLVLAEAGNYIFNFIHLRKYVNFKKIDYSSLNIKKHIKPALKIFVLNLVISIYVNLDSVMLGFLKDNISVGYYTAATRLTRALCGIAGSLSIVLFPRFSNYYHGGKFDEFNKIVQESMTLIVTITIPITIGLIMTSPLLIPLFCGELYTPAILTLQILSPIILFIGISNILGTRILYAINRENIVIASTIAGAIINFSLNLLLIPKYMQFGAALSSVIAEFVVVCLMILLSRKYLFINIFNRTVALSTFFSMIMCVPILFIIDCELSSSIKLLLAVVTAASIYLIGMFLIDNILKKYMQGFINKCFK